MLGIWGSRDETGKDAADDIRRRKQSLPILMLRAQANEDDATRLDALYGGDEINPTGIGAVLALLDRYQIAKQVADQVEQAHQRAQEALARALPDRHPDDTSGLLQLIAALQSRTS
jgi:geranylgeranyl pyrophosphate synthase